MNSSTRNQLSTLENEAQTAKSLRARAAELSIAIEALPAAPDTAVDLVARAAGFCADYAAFAYARTTRLVDTVSQCAPNGKLGEEKLTPELVTHCIEAITAYGSVYVALTAAAPKLAAVGQVAAALAGTPVSGACGVASTESSSTRAFTGPSAAIGWGASELHLPIEEVAAAYAEVKAQRKPATAAAMWAAWATEIGERRQAAIETASAA